MLNIIKNVDGSIILSDTFTNPIQFEAINTEYTYTIYMIKDILTLNKFKYTSEGEVNSRLLELSYSISESNKNKWTEWLCLEPNDSNILPNFISPDIYYDIKIKWKRIGTSDISNIKLNNFEWSGTYYINESNSVLNNLSHGQTVIIKAANVYKIFKIKGVDITTQGEHEFAKLDIRYRFTQTKDMNWSKWEILTNENISTIKISPIRFAWFEFSVSRVGTDTNGYVGLIDINIYGDIQNVTADSKKTNLFSLRDCCTKHNGGAAADNTNSCEPPDIFKNILNDSEKMTKLFDPYNLNKEAQLISALNISANVIFGVSTIYFATSPDKKGVDHTFHEYQLKNYVDYKDIKVTVDKNQFPDNQISFNMFDLDLFETFEVQISKEVFKHTFGVERRPIVDDFLYICDQSRMYQVQHAQAYRDFNNSSTYYKLVLTKFNQKSNIIPQNNNIKNMIDSLINNTTQEELFGIDLKNDKLNVSSKPELATLSKDLIRYKYAAKINRELIDNASLVVSTHNYSLNYKLENSDISVKYFNSDSFLRKGDNRAMTFWFKFDNYVVNEVYNLIDNYNTTLDRGYKINIYNDIITFTINGNDYNMNISNIITDGVWYCYLVNLDQRDRNITQYLYTRNVDSNKQNQAKNLNSSVLKLLKRNSSVIEPNEFEFNSNDSYLSIKSSNMNITNIKIYNVTIDELSHTKVLNQNIVRETEFIILCDICNLKVNLANYPLN